MAIHRLEEALLFPKLPRYPVNVLAVQMSLILPVVGGPLPHTLALTSLAPTLCQEVKGQWWWWWSNMVLVALEWFKVVPAVMVAFQASLAPPSPL